MKSFFKYFLITFIIVQPFVANAGVNSIAERQTTMAIDPNVRLNEMKKLYNEFPDLQNPQDVRKYLQKRLSIITQAEVSKDELSTPSTKCM